MSKLVCECKDGYCNFKPIFEDKEQTKFKYFQCADCGYIMTNDDIRRQLVMCGLHGDFCKFIDKTITYYKDGNNDEYNDGYIIGSIVTAKELGIIDNEQAEKLIEKSGVNADFYNNEEEQQDEESR